MSDPDGELIASSGKIELRRANITQIVVDAVVNAANTQLRGGAGVNGAIQAAAGPLLLHYCERTFLDGCATGSAEITPSYNMTNCDWVIHAVGPNYYRKHKPGGNLELDAQAEAHLRGCYTKSLQLAVSAEARSIAFPTISTGIYKFPNNTAALNVMRAVRDFLATADGQQIDRVVFLIFKSHADEAEYRRLLPQFFPTGGPPIGGGGGYGNNTPPQSPVPENRLDAPSGFPITSRVNKMLPTTVPADIFEQEKRNETTQRGRGGRTGEGFSGGVSATTPVHILLAREEVYLRERSLRGRGARARRNGSRISGTMPAQNNEAEGRGNGGMFDFTANTGNPISETPSRGRGRGRPRGTFRSPVVPRTKTPANQVQPVTKPDPKKQSTVKPASPKKAGPVPSSKPATNSNKTVSEPDTDKADKDPQAKRAADPQKEDPKARPKKANPKATTKPFSESAPELEPEKNKRGRKRKATEEPEGSERPAPDPPQIRLIARGHVPRELEIDMVDAQVADTRQVGGRTLRGKRSAPKRSKGEF